MTLPVVWIEDAVTEYYEALRWYEKAGSQVGQRFAHAVDDAVTSIATGPMLFQIIDKDRRRAGIRHFPYGLFFLVEEDRIVVIACFHGKRDPRQWKRR